MIRSILLFSILLSAADVNSHSVKLPENWDRIVLKFTSGEPSDDRVNDTSGTGFLLRYRKQIFAVTNHHVMNPKKTTIEMVIINSIGERNSYSISVDSTVYMSDKTYDVAIVALPPSMDSLDYGFIQESMIGSDSIVKIGSEMYSIGFPSKQYGHDNFTPLVRSGIVSGVRIDRILFDSDIVGGSSGSPVFINIETMKESASYLVGIGQASVLTQQRDSLGNDLHNRFDYFGLGIAIKVKYIVKLMDRWFDRLPSK